MGFELRKGKLHQSFDFLIDIPEIALYITVSSTKNVGVSERRLGLKVAGFLDFDIRVGFG